MPSALSADLRSGAKTPSATAISRVMTHVPGNGASLTVSGVPMACSFCRYAVSAVRGSKIRGEDAVGYRDLAGDDTRTRQRSLLNGKWRPDGMLVLPVCRQRCPRI